MRAEGQGPGVLGGAADAARDIMNPAGDLHATAGYRKHVAGILLRRAVTTAFGLAGAEDRRDL